MDNRHYCLYFQLKDLWTDLRNNNIIDVSADGVTIYALLSLDAHIKVQ